MGELRQETVGGIAIMLFGNMRAVMRIGVSLLVGIGIEGMAIGVVDVEVLVLGSVETAQVQAWLRGEGMMGVGKMRLVVLLEGRGLRLKAVSR